MPDLLGVWPSLCLCQGVTAFLIVAYLVCSDRAEIRVHVRDVHVRLTSEGLRRVEESLHLSSVGTVVDDFLAFHVHYTEFLRVGRFELAGSVCLEVYPCSQRSIGTEGYLFGLYLFSHQPYATGTLLLRK